MHIIAHRGVWLEKEQRNTLDAFKKAYDSGFGIEYDVRDYDGDLVISHDIPNEKSITLSQFCEHYKLYGNDLKLATNIKSDGLQDLIKKYFEKYQISNYFLFDMAVPDAILYKKKGFENLFTRQSQFEKYPSFYEISLGVWMDEFNGEEWVTEDVIQSHIDANKKVCIVSPELHNIDEYLLLRQNGLPEKLKKRWGLYKAFKNSKSFMLCTDFPYLAEEFFKD